VLGGRESLDITQNIRLKKKIVFHLKGENKNGNFKEKNLSKTQSEC
jgi:hypothetical protein